MCKYFKYVKEINTSKLRKFHQDYRDWAHSYLDYGCGDVSISLVQWFPPAARHVKFNVDGSCSMHSNIMGGSGAIRNHEGKWFLGFSSSFGVGSAVEAEFFAMEQGLLLAWNEGFRSVVLECDCLEAMQIITESLVVRYQRISKVVSRIRKLLARCWVVHISFIHSETNLLADFMTRKCALSGSSLKIWVIAPTGASDFLVLDVLA
ncbi:PREDICTED: uncharacterized protein LOC109361796 [Lupinus angustifolius]|uniref:uncharacterized protein LOC109361796 n=1 Tax=Lupinus angustifolius TaxID=3871 RepID=UPI00092E5A42|nr:PREDICTED: uncharacterized protein LOC109361796 [Lupinus angustifolius]